MNAVVALHPAPAPLPAFGMGEMETIANAIARGGLFGSRDPYAVLTLCLVAQAEGKHPGLVMQQYDLIQGKPAKKAQAMQVDFLAAGGRIEWHQYDDEAADATFSHPAGGTVRVRWDMPRAVKAGLGGKDMWKKFPRQMLRSRTISEGVRTVFPGATGGFYVPEEVADFASDAAPTTPPAQRARDLTADKPALTDTSPGRAKAETWVDEQLQAVANAADADALDAIIAGGHKAVAKLAREHADLHGRVQAAYEARGNELAGYGRDDADHGDPTDPDSASARMARDLLGRCTNAATKADLDAIGEALGEQYDALDADQRQAVEQAYATAKKRVGK